MTTFSTCQDKAIQKFIDFMADPDQTEMAILGHAGTGKSFLTHYLLELVKKMNAAENSLAQSNDAATEVFLTATTNKAVKVLSDLAGTEAKTIHSLLNLKPVNDFKTGEKKLVQHSAFDPFWDSLIVVDEASMVSDEVLKFIRQSSNDCKVLYILDPYQLAPIGEADCPVAKQVTNSATLKHIFRQKNGSANPIAILAEHYRQVQDGAPFPKITEQKPEVLRVNGTTFQDMVKQEYATINHNTEQSKILAWSNKMVNKYNSFIRGMHTNSDKFLDGEWAVTNQAITDARGKMLAKTDDIVRVISVEDVPHRIKGIDAWVIDLGFSFRVYQPVDPGQYRKELMSVKRKCKKSGDWSDFFNFTETFVDLRPAYASTVHKSQGSTHEKVFINLNDIGKNRDAKEVARLMYVALTRATDQVILYGSLGGKYGDYSA